MHVCVWGVGWGVDSIALFPLWDVNFSGGSGIGEPAAAPKPIGNQSIPKHVPSIPLHRFPETGVWKTRRDGVVEV